MKGQLTILIFVCVLTQANAQTNAFYFTSSPQSFIGQGKTLLATTTNGYAFSGYSSSVYMDSVTFNIGSSGNPPTLWILSFSTATPPFTVGSYSNAVRFPDGGGTAPGLDFSGDGRGDNTLTGSFDILELSFSTNHTLISFAADFIQYDNGNPNEWNEGSIRYNSTIPIPEPSALAIISLCSFCCLLARQKLPRRAVSRKRGIH